MFTYYQIVPLWAKLVLAGQLFGTIKYFSPYGVGGHDTGINVKAGGGGRSLLVICSSHYANGTSTRMAIYAIRCGYDVNFIEPILIAKSTDSLEDFSFSVSDSGTLVVNNPNNICKYQIIGT